MLALTRRRWEPAPPPGEAPARPLEAPPPDREAPSRRGLTARLAFTAIETGVESAAGVWGYVFLTSARGFSQEAAGLAVSAYWAMMFAGRVVLGPVAERAGAARVLTLAVAGVPIGAGSLAAGTVPLQVAAAAAGSSLVPACIGLAIGASAAVLGPSLLVLSLAMCPLLAAARSAGPRRRMGSRRTFPRARPGS